MDKFDDIPDNDNQNDEIDGITLEQLEQFKQFLSLFMPLDAGAATSPNYHSVFTGIKTAYFKTEDFAAITADEALARGFLKEALAITKAKGIEVPEKFYEMPIHLYPNKGIIFEVPDPRYECECNFAALTCKEPKEMFTSELFLATNSFELCLTTKEFHSVLTDKISSFEDFYEATIGKMD